MIIMDPRTNLQILYSVRSDTMKLLNSPHPFPSDVLKRLSEKRRKIDLLTIWYELVRYYYLKYGVFYQLVFYEPKIVKIKRDDYLMAFLGNDLRSACIALLFLNSDRERERLK